VVQPRLATAVSTPFSREGWLFEPKWDDYRAICFLRDSQVRFASRNQRDLTKGFPELQSIAKSIKASTAIIDDEIVALDENGVQCFEQLQNQTRDCAILYFAFDLLYLDGESLTDLALIQRKPHRKRIFPKSLTGRLRFTLLRVVWTYSLHSKRSNSNVWSRSVQIVCMFLDGRTIG